MRNEHHDTDTSATIKQVTEEIYQLAEEQTKALKQATFLGMTTDEASHCDSRRGRIRHLIRELQQLQNRKESME
jgi:hypothetical protein